MIFFVFERFDYYPRSMTENKYSKLAEHMDIHQINKYWADNEEELCKYKPSQLNNSRLLRSTIDFLISCGLPESCAPGLSFEQYDSATILTPNEVFKIDFDELNDYLMIGTNDSGDPVSI